MRAGLYRNPERRKKGGKKKVLPIPICLISDEIRWISSFRENGAEGEGKGVSRMI